MFYVKHTDGECDPVVRCHVCATAISSVAKAVVVYERTADEGQTSRVVVVHRDACLPKATALLVNDHGEPHSIAFDKFLERLRSGATVDC
jgi:hypothetical protein